jgi:hypothetical protein
MGSLKTSCARLVIALVLAALWGTGCATTRGAAGAVPGAVDWKDPAGDDNGPGQYVYPTDKVYKAGSFDLTRFEVVPSGDTVELRVGVNSSIEDPWESRAWGGNGFSVQMAVVFIDTDHQKGSGQRDGLPGLNVRFAEDEAWDRAVIISPQGPTRVNAEIDEKCPQWKQQVLVPKVTRAAGRTLIAVVNTADLGGAPQASWGYQVLMQSNEGFPAKTDLLTRKVNEYEGQHRFGGGTDYDNDPHVMDLLIAPGAGGEAEAKAQHEALAKYNKETQEPKPEDLAVVPMVYAGAAAAK